MEQSYFGSTEKRSLFFYFAIALMLAAEALSINTDLAEYAQHNQLNIPGWFFSAVFAVDALVVLCIAGIYFYRKAAVIAMPLLIFLHFSLHSFYLSTTLYSDLNLLFIYFCAGLLAVIPRWNYFKNI